MRSKIDESTIQDAVHAYSSTPEEKRSIRYTAHEYNIPESTLRHRLHGRLPATEAHQHRRLLSPTQFKTLKETIKRLDGQGFALEYSFIRDTVEEMVGQKPGVNWCTTWIAGDSDLQVMFHHAQDKSRQAATNYDSFKSFFDKVFYPSSCRTCH